MLQADQQTEAINASLALVDLMAQFQGIKQQAILLSERFTRCSYLTVLAAMPTAPWSSDGTEGTPDETPVGTNPITAGRLYLAANDITGGVYLLNDFIAFMGNGAVSTADRNADVARLVR